MTNMKVAQISAMVIAAPILSFNLFLNNHTLKCKMDEIRTVMKAISRYSFGHKITLTITTTRIAMIMI